LCCCYADGEGGGQEGRYILLLEPASHHSVTGPTAVPVVPAVVGVIIKVGVLSVVNVVIAGPVEVGVAVLAVVFIMDVISITKGVFKEKKIYFQVFIYVEKLLNLTIKW